MFNIVFARHEVGGKIYKQVRVSFAFHSVRSYCSCMYHIDNVNYDNI